MSLKKLAAGVALTTLASLAATGAYAQSTASQVSEVIVTTNGVRSTGGLAVQTQVAKNQSIVTQQFIQNQVGSVNAAQLINMLPGVSYSTGDPTGVLSDDFRIHGFDGNHVSWTIDGTPVNDTGNYATFPGEYLTGEVTDRVTVNIGQTEVDSPSASAIGGTVNIVTKTPPRTFGVQASAGAGSYNYYRGYAEIDTGEIGPWGTRAFISANGIHSNKYQGGGTIEREGVDFRVYQPLKDADFISIAGTYNANRPYFYESSSLAQYAQFGRKIDFNTQWGVPTVTPGKADGVGGPATATAPGFLQGSDSGQGFWAYHQNPVDFGDIRIQSRFDLSHGFTLTADPYFFYTLANGGGSTALKENDLRFAGASGKPACVDLNGDGDCLDTVLAASPNNTQTHRFGISTSLLYDLDEHNHFQLSYNLDYGNHRQTGAYSHINQQTGFPDSPFGGLRGQTFATQDGAVIRGRDRFSVAELNQVSFNYIGKFIDNRLHVNIGVRDPMLTRKLNQFCYTLNGTSAYCDTVSQALVQAAYNTDLAANRAGGASAAALTTILGTNVSTGNAGAPNFRFPFKQTLTYSKVLPNAGASYNFDASNQVYATYAQGFSAPRTDNLYSSSLQSVKPELTDNYGVGYRFQSGMVTASVNPWYSLWTNHIVTTFDRDDPTISIDRNVGKVSLYGVDLEAGLRPVEHLSLYASASFMKSRLESNYPVAVSAGPNKGAIVDLPVKGKELVLTPDQAFSLRGEYEIGPLTVALQGKYTGRRFNADMNDQALPGFTVVDLDAEFKVPGTHDTTVLQLNVNNLFNAQYYNRSGTVSAAQTVQLGNGNTFSPGTPFYFVGAPTTVYGTLKVKF
jgi:iron complex outermembrane receptor protein